MTQKYKGGAVRICSFGDVELPPAKEGYNAFREAVLKVGRFSVFEATESERSANLYDRLCRDPEVMTAPMGFPWTRVQLREPAK